MEGLVTLPPFSPFVWYILSREVLKEREPSAAEAGGFVADPDSPEKGPSSFLLQMITCLWASLLWPKRKMLSLSVTYF